jgi:tyrosine-specific transport protein
MMKFDNLTGSLLLAGTFIGVGILGLPYALSKSGFLGGTAILFLGAFFSYLTAMYIVKLVYLQSSEVSLYTIFRRYLGRNTSYLALAGMLISSYGAMIAYPIAIGEMMHSLLNLPYWLGAGLFIVLITFLLTLKAGHSNRINALVTVLLLVLLVWVMLRATPSITLENYLFFKPSRMLDAWGIVIFAFAGHLVIPSVIYAIKAKPRQGALVIKSGFWAVAILYFFFFAVSLDIMGQEVTAVATLGLSKNLSPALSTVGQLFAILAILTSSYGVGISLKLTFEDKLKVNSSYAIPLIIVPVILFSTYLGSEGGEAFSNVLNIAGGIGSALYVGLIPSIIVLKLSKIYRFPLGQKGAIATVLFFGLAIAYTILF